MSETVAPGGPGGPGDRGAGGARGIVTRLVRQVQADDVLGLSAEMAFRFLFAIFPFGLFVAALSSFVATALNIDNPAREIIAALGDNLPSAVADALRPELERLVESPRADLLSIGAIAALWAATSGTNALVKGIHRAYGVAEERPLVLRYAVAIGLTLLGAAGIIASFVTIVGGALLTEQLAQQAGVGGAAYRTLELLRWPAVGLLLVLAVSILYRYAPNVVVPWRAILLGSVAFAIGWLVATAALGLYVTTIGDYGATYGSLAGVIVLMLWFYVTAALLLLGAELTAAVARERTPEQITVRTEEQRAAGALERAEETASHKVDEETRRLRQGGLDRPPP